MPSSLTNGRWLPPDGAERSEAVFPALWDYACEGEHGFVAKLWQYVDAGLFSFPNLFFRNPHIYVGFQTAPRPDVRLQVGDARTCEPTVCGPDDSKEKLILSAGVIGYHLDTHNLPFLALCTARADHLGGIPYHAQSQFKGRLDGLVVRIGNEIERQKQLHMHP